MNERRRQSKPWWKSKTIWANVISAAVAVLLLVSQSPSFAEYGEYLALAQGILNIVLRLVTTQPVTS